MWNRAICNLVGLTLLLFGAAGARGEDVSAGLKLAEEACARCHNIAAGAPFKLRPPSFQAIAIYYTPDGIWSQMLATSSHPGMPDLVWTLNSEQMNDLVAYITSLDRSPAP
jgi:mono/diheme cytochrome c family protein